MVKRIGKHMTMHKALPTRDDWDSLYVLRKNRGRGPASIQNRTDTSIWKLEDYIKKRRGRLIKTNRNNTGNTSINWTTINRKQKWEEKQLYGHFKWQTSEILHEKTRTRQGKGDFKKEIESRLIAIQNNAICSNYIKGRIDKTQQNSRYRLCGNRDLIINDITSECSKLTQRNYQSRHDWAGKVIHLE